MKKLFLVSCLLAAVSASAGVQPINWDQLVKACKSDSGLPNQQIKPTNIVVTCQDTRTSWEQVQGSLSLPQSRSVQTAVQSSKYSVGTVSGNVPVGDQAGVCVDYKQVVLTATFSKSTTCDELLNPVNGNNGVEFCEKVMDQQFLTNPDSYEMRDSGRKANICSNGSSGK